MVGMSNVIPESTVADKMKGVQEPKSEEGK